MNISSPNTKKILIGLGVIILLGGLAYYFLGNSSSVVIDIIAPSDTATVGEDILVLVDKLKAVSIDKSAFSGALFTSLQDYSIPLNPESQGRLNPFAQIGVEK